MTARIFKNIYVFILLVLLQVLIIKNLNLGVYVVLFPYVLFILSMPFETPRLLLMFLSFFGGLCLDFFYNTPGLHASACTASGFARYYVLKYMSPREGYDPSYEPCVDDMGPAWYINYSSILVAIHHLFFFFLEAFKFDEFFRTLFRTVLSSIGTILLVYLLQFLVFNRRAKK